LKYPSPYIVCADKFRISIQADPDLYCTYSEDGLLTEVEIACKPSIETLALKDQEQGGFPDSSELLGWKVFGHVPIVFVKQIILNHGGVVENFEYLPKELQDDQLDSREAVHKQWDACLGVPL
jgi:hypothetical protein